MSVISGANLLSLTDHIAAIWISIGTDIGTKIGTATPGNIRYLGSEILTTTLALNDYEQETDLLTGAYASSSNDTQEIVGKFIISPILNALSSHLRTRGTEVSSTIIDIPTYLTYLNSTLFTDLVAPGMLSAYTSIYGVALPVVGCMSPYIGPINTQTNGLGTATYTNTFTAGASVATGSYSAVNPLLVISTSFAGGAAALGVSVTGTDQTGVSETWIPVVTLPTNPTAAFSTTLTEATTAQARQTITLASLTGIVAGSVLTIDTGTLQESIVVESATISSITAVFQYAHLNGAAVTGYSSYSLSPSISRSRCVSVTGITLTVPSGTTAGAVRIDGIQDRIPI